MQRGGFAARRRVSEGRVRAPQGATAERWRARYTGAVDRVRLGRALGYGTRHAAKTVAALAEAAAAPGPAPKGATRAGGVTEAAPAPATAAAPTIESPVRAGRVGPAAPRNLGQGVRHLKRSFWGPLATFSGALWLRVTGLFFALIAFAMGEGAWRLRGAWHAADTPVQMHRFWLFLAFALLFGYFAVSSFVRAALKERRAAAGRV